MDIPAKRVQGAASSDDSKPRTLVRDIYHRLRAEIIRGHLVPGIRLRAEHLKSEYNVSGATMREALALLVADALVVSREQRGFIVAPVSVADFADITDTRALMESQAVRMSVRHGDDEWEANLSGAFRRLSLAEERREPGGDDNYWEECNRKFHEALIAGHESPWLHHFLKILYHQSERYRRIARFNAPPERDVHKEHVSIFEAAIARDEDAACKLIEQHIRVTLSVIKTLDAPFTELNAA
jgi:GntR family transcriptional regulator, carbon starvation induced regulator